MPNLKKMLALSASVLAPLFMTACYHHQADVDSSSQALPVEQGSPTAWAPVSDIDAVGSLDPGLGDNARVYFDFDKPKGSARAFQFSDKQKTVLNAEAHYLNDHPEIAYRIEGHADRVGTKEYNIALAERRARAVKFYLEGQGVPAHQLRTVSYGSEAPVCLENTPECYQRNRRTMLVFDKDVTPRTSVPPKIIQTNGTGVAPIGAA